jgi:rRNA biogenesis protein RRP5
LSEISSVSSILPGTLVQALVTASHSTGLNLLVLGYFEGTIDSLHLRNEGSSYKIGKKIKARILYNYSSSSPPKFSLALTEHVVNLTVRQSQEKNEEVKKAKDIQDAYPVGTLLEAVKVLRIEPERGLIVEVEPGLEGFIHVCLLFLFLFRQQLLIMFHRYLMPQMIIFLHFQQLAIGNLVLYIKRV